MISVARPRPLSFSIRSLLFFRTHCRRPTAAVVAAVVGSAGSYHSFSSKTTTFFSSSPDESSLAPVPSNAHRIVLMRHGESAFNNANVFTGWCDVALTQRGIVEAVEAGEVFRSHNIIFRHCYSSLLTRSIVTAQRALEAAGVSFTPMSTDWRFNERHYGALQGLSKDRTAERLGKSKVMVWRRSYHGRPPVMTPEHPHYSIIQDDVRYHHVHIPTSESLQDTQERVVQAWNGMLDNLQNSDNNNNNNNNNNNTTTTTTGMSDSPYTLVVAHANSLRALVMYLDDIPAQDIESLNIPTAIPFYYDIDLTTHKVVDNSLYHDVTVHGKFRGVYISDERKKRNFLERRRAANDPWTWALHDDQVASSMLTEENNNDNDNGNGENDGGLSEEESMNSLTKEAARNTELFASTATTRTQQKQKSQSQQKGDYFMHHHEH